MGDDLKARFDRQQTPAGKQAIKNIECMADRMRKETGINVKTGRVKELKNELTGRTRYYEE